MHPSVNLDKTGSAWVLQWTAAASLVLTKLDGAGAVLASRPLTVSAGGGLIPPRAWRVAFEPSGNLVLAGTGQGAVDFGGGARVLGSARGAFVARYDANGGYVADRTFVATGRGTSPIGFAFGNGVAVDASGNVVLGGSFLGNLDLGSSLLSSCGYHPFLLKFDPTP